MSAAGPRRQQHGCTTSGTTARNTFSRSRRRGPAKASASSSRRCWHGRNRPSSTTSRARTGPRRPASARSNGTSASSSRQSKRRAASRFNPLSEVRLFTPRDVSDAQNIANMIVRTGEDSPQERYWQDAAASITTGMILHVCYEAALKAASPRLADLAHVFTKPGCSFRETLEGADQLSSTTRRIAHNWRMPTGERPRRTRSLRRRCRRCSTRRTGTSAGVLSTAKTALTLYSDPLVAREHLRQRFHHQRPGELRAADFAVPGCAAFGQDSAAAV